MDGDVGELGKDYVSGAGWSSDTVLISSTGILYWDINMGGVIWIEVELEYLCLGCLYNS